MTNIEKHVDSPGSIGIASNPANSIGEPYSYLFLPKGPPVETEGPKHTRAVLDLADAAIKLQHMNEKLQKDPMTGLMSREAFDGELEKSIIKQEKLGEKAPGLGVMFIDLDNFKKVNDTLGHTEGDKAIVSFSEYLTERLRLRKGDVVCSPSRFSSKADEFAVIFRTSVGENMRRNKDGGTSKEESLGSAKERALEQTRGLLKQYMDETIHELGEDAREMAKQLGIDDFGISVGLAIYEPGDTRDSLLKKADEAMYKKKNKKKEAVDQSLTD